MPLRSLCTSSTHDILAASRPCTVARRCCLLFLLRSCSRDQCSAGLQLSKCNPKTYRAGVEDTDVRLAGRWRREGKLCGERQRTGVNRAGGRLSRRVSAAVGGTRVIRRRRRKGELGVVRQWWQAAAVVSLRRSECSGLCSQATRLSALGLRLLLASMHLCCPTDCQAAAASVRSAALLSDGCCR